MMMRLVGGLATAVVSLTPITGTALPPTAIPGATLYPRLIEVRTNASLKGRLVLATLGGIQQSRDEGLSWTRLSAVPQPAGTTERCCGVMYELPRKVGSLAAGTLLYAATYHRGPRTSIRLYRSDNGSTWFSHGEIAAGGTFGKGVWEPQFDIARDGALVVFWSDETDPCCSQRLRRARSYDGSRWEDASDVVRGSDPADRPGMATTAQLSDGRTSMTYEMCGPRHCAVFIRYSTDGWTYGDPIDPGERIETADGLHLEHAPTSTSTGKRLLVVGQLVVENTGKVSPWNGRIILASDGRGGPWQSIQAPVAIPGAYDNYCPNYASALLPRDHGRELLMVASAYDTDNRCVAFSSERSLP